jgi:branched-chain amino acid transport system ATP-binding protein
MSEFLVVEGLSKRFGGLTAVSDVSFSLKQDEIFGVIGPNGAGKTTLFNVIAGYYKPTAGKVTFESDDVTGHPSDEVARRGIARTFQAVYNFQQHTVAENLRRSEVIARCHSPLAYLAKRRTNSRVDSREVADFVGLTANLESKAGSLAYGQQKILGIGMAMMVSPKLMLMDEPAAGLNSSEKKAVSRLIRKLREERGISILIVEHDMPLVMGLCDRILVVNQGAPIALGTPAEVKTNVQVIDAYLGEDYEFA